FGGDRITLWEFVEGGKLAVMSQFFAMNGAEPPVRSFLNEEIPYILSRIQQNKIFHMSRTADLPASASLDRETLQRSGVKSMLSVPIFMAGTLRGFLSLATVWSERAWLAETIMQLTRIAAVLGNVLERRVSFKLLEERIRFETLIADLSARFINIPSEEVDAAISTALDRVRTFYQADYCALFEADVATSETRLPYISYAPNVIHLPDDLIPRQAFPWAYDIVFLQGKPNIRERNDDLPPEAEIDRKSNKAIGVEAAINIPVDYGSPTAYCLTVATVRQRSWPADYIPRLRLLGEIIVEALKRKRLDVELKRSYEEIVTLKNRLELEADYLRSEIRGGSKHDAIIGQSEALTNVLTQVEQVAPTASTVLICGETGTGKELVAQAVHNLSSRRDRLLVTVNCASLPAGAD
ncbi:MAG: GAF domain-containing protein, partial [Deltaproteobacteria bacterium]|nr:GAF domain-containing protein [Deltaproteobacteria bacterium]